MFTVNSADSSSFNLSNFIPFDKESGYDPLNSEFRRRLVQLPVAGRFVVSANDAFRADLMSYQIYGTTQYWWILLDYNHLDSPEQLSIGTKISYPSIVSLTDLFQTVNKMTSQSMITEFDKPVEYREVFTEIKFLSPKDGVLNFEPDSLEAQLIEIGPSGIEKEVRFEPENSKFYVDKVESDGKTYYRVMPRGFNYSSSAQVLGSVTFVLQTTGNPITKTCKFIQKARS